MTGISKSNKIKTLERLYEQKGIKCNRKEIRDLSTRQLARRIIEIRGYKLKSGGHLVG